MAVYNAEPWLREAVDSVLAQGMTDWELLAVDDGSTDGSLRILQDYALGDGRVRVFHKENNEGLASARNLALREARGEFVCTLDADDWLSANALEVALERFRGTDTDCVVFRLVEHEGGETLVRHEPLPLDAVIRGDEAFRLSLDWSLHGLFLIRRELVMRYPYDESLRLYSDDNTVRLQYLHSRFVTFCSGEYHYRKHSMSATGGVSVLRFQHLLANRQMRDILQSESTPQAVVEEYERVRWYNFRAMLRFFHVHYGSFSSDERRDIRSLLREVYGGFCHFTPYPLYELRDWMGTMWAKMRKR